MATPLGWSQGGSGSVCLAFDQLRDVIESQEELIHQLRNVVGSRSTSGSGIRPPVGVEGVASGLCEGASSRRRGSPSQGRNQEERGAFLNFTKPGNIPHSAWLPAEGTSGYLVNFRPRQPAHPNQIIP